MAKENIPQILVTGGAGFIGSNLVHLLVQDKGASVINLDKLTYAGNPASVADLEGEAGYTFVCADICDSGAIRRVFSRHQPDAVIHLAAESHVDRSITGPGQFMETNVKGTYVLLEEARQYWMGLKGEDRERFRFLSVSTDEVYGSLGDSGAFSETTAYNPSSPYSATKAGADHLARAYFHTYGLPVLVTNCSNNYGPFQFPEKMIPLMITRALAGEPMPVYGKGENIRDWLYVGDHCEALWTVLQQGLPGRTYNIGGGQEVCNIDLVRRLCGLLQQMAPPAVNSQVAVERYEELISFVEDRPGHDYRYAIDAGRIEEELNWRPREDFASGLKKTIQWYLDNGEWIQGVASGDYRKWIDENYGNRL